MSDKSLTLGQAGAPMEKRGAQNPVLRQIWRHWEALRAGRIAPMRRELDPGAIAQVLENAFILERAAPTVTRFRLAGLALCDIMGMELRGMPSDALMQADARPQFDAAVDRVFDRGEIAELKLALPGGPTTAYAEMLLLPMRDDFGRLNRALGALVASPELLTRTPCRFSLAEVAHTRVVAMESDPEPRRPVDGFRDSPARFEAPAPRKTPGQLRLVALGGRRIDDRDA